MTDSEKDEMRRKFIHFKTYVEANDGGIPKEITIHLPDDEYQRLSKIAELSKKTVEDLVIMAIRSKYL